MKDILDYMIVVLMILSIIFVQIIVIDLRRRKIIKSFFDPHIYIPFYIFDQYIKVTKEETGSIGWWFWLAVSSVAGTLLAAILYEIL
jgi:hypothetical protein